MIVRFLGPSTRVLLTADTGKLALRAPAGMVTETGTWAAAGLLLDRTMTTLRGPALERVTVPDVAFGPAPSLTLRLARVRVTFGMSLSSTDNVANDERWSVAEAVMV